MLPALSTGWMISQELFDWILQNLPARSTIVELGSGDGTAYLTQHFTVHSVEHDPAWIGRAPDARYIPASIVRYDNFQWYDAQIVRRLLPSSYDLLLVDGPPGRIGREGLLHHFDLFRHDVPVLIDDCNRPSEYALLLALAERTGRPWQILPSSKRLKDGTHVTWGILFPTIQKKHTVALR
jgi:hypothetical protein